MTAEHLLDRLCVCVCEAAAVLIFETVIVNYVAVVLTDTPALQLFEALRQTVDCQCPIALQQIGVN